MSKLALKIQRYCKSLLLLELLKGAWAHGAVLDSGGRSRSSIRRKRRHNRGVFGASMRCGAIRMEKSGVSPASSVRPCAPQSPLRSTLRRGPTELGARHDMTSTCSSAFTVASARRHARQMPSCRHGFSNGITRSEATRLSARSGCWRSATAWKQRSQRTVRWMHPIADSTTFVQWA